MPSLSSPNSDFVTRPKCHQCPNLSGPKRLFPVKVLKDAENQSTVEAAPFKLLFSAILLHVKYHLVYNVVVVFPVETPAGETSGVSRGLG